MKFDTFDSLITFLAEKNIKLSDLNILHENCEECNILETAPPECVDNLPVEEPVAVNSIVIESFITPQKMNFKIGDENILVVENLDFPYEACGWRVVKLNDKDMHLNVCRQGDMVKTNLKIKVNESIYKDVLFKLVEKSKDLDYDMILDKKTLLFAKSG